MSGEHLFPAPPLGLAKGDVLGRPHEQRRSLPERWQAPLDLGEKWPAGEDLVRKHVQRTARLRRGKRAAVGTHHDVGELLALDVAGEDLLDEEVSAQNEVAADRAAHQAREDLRAGVGLRPRPGVADHERREAIGMASRDCKPDRAAPVLHHHRDVLELEPQD